VKSSKGFTLIEMVVVVGLIGVLAVVAISYGSKWRYQWKFSNIYNSAQTTIKMTRMYAMSVGTDTTLYFTNSWVDPTTHSASLTTKFTSGDFAQMGPWLVDTATNPRRVAYFLYNTVWYSFTPSETAFTFNGRGFPKNYQPQTVTLTSPRLKKSFTINVTAVGKIQ
jgi:prepilin-type N-terminal cleavage/methylation domain-containing protein